MDDDFCCQQLCDALTDMLLTAPTQLSEYYIQQFELFTLQVSVQIPEDPFPSSLPPSTDTSSCSSFSIISGTTSTSSTCGSASCCCE
ncbi:Hypothetical predicted protein [Scomber scombrus]|uniref:Uncharacterized protein n=1 Tax=Scomber scombrus TaxID=13677 RepID=A0AAV1Q8A1_SCOSC